MSLENVTTVNRSDLTDKTTLDGTETVVLSGTQKTTTQAIADLAPAPTSESPITSGTGENSAKMPTNNTVTGSDSIALNRNNTVSGNNSIAIGYGNECEAENSFVGGEGSYVGREESTSSIVKWALAFGYQCKVWANYAIALGYKCVSSGVSSFTFGGNNTASSDNALAGGSTNTASGNNAVALGRDSQATHSQAFTNGRDNVAGAISSTTQGRGLVSYVNNQHVRGQYNVDRTGVSSTLIDVVGGGTGTSDRKDIETLDSSGNKWVEGGISMNLGGSTTYQVLAVQSFTNGVLTLVSADITE